MMIPIVRILMGVIMDLRCVVGWWVVACCWRLLGVLIVTLGYPRMIGWNLRVLRRDLGVMLRSLRDMIVTEIWTETWAIVFGRQLVRGTQVF